MTWCLFLEERRPAFSLTNFLLDSFLLNNLLSFILFLLLGGVAGGLLSVVVSIILTSNQQACVSSQFMVAIVNPFHIMMSKAKSMATPSYLPYDLDSLDDEDTPTTLQQQLHTRLKHELEQSGVEYRDGDQKGKLLKVVNG